MKSFCKFSAFVALPCVSFQIFVLKVLVRLFAVSHEAMYSSSSFHMSSSCRFFLSSTSSNISLMNSSPNFLFSCQAFFTDHLPGAFLSLSSFHFSCELVRHRRTIPSGSRLPSSRRPSRILLCHGPFQNCKLTLNFVPEGKETATTTKDTLIL